MSTTRQPWMDDHDYALTEIGDRFAIPARDHKGMTTHRLGLSAMVEAWRANMLDGVPTAASITRGRLLADGAGEVVGYQSTVAMAEMLDAWGVTSPAGRDVWVQAATEQIAQWEGEAA